MYTSLKVRAVAWRVLMFEAIRSQQMKMTLSCYSAVGDTTALYFSVLHYLRTQRNPHRDAAPV